MTQIRVTVTLSALGNASPSVRFWVGPMERSSLAEIEIAMTANGGGVWTGYIPVRVLGKSGYFLYRLAIATNPKAVWALQIEDETDGSVLTCDSDEVVHCKTWLVGSCYAASVAGTALSLVGPDASARRCSNVTSIPLRRGDT